MNVTRAALAAVAVKPAQYPEDVRPEIAFVGKSNVGKSSLINCMLNRKALAKTSQTPGKTRTINFYAVDFAERKDALYFVDLPGYGYAKISRSESDKWGAMVENYLLKRGQLKSIVLLVDIRHEPSTNDRLMFNWLKHYGYAMTVAATKLDKINRSQTGSRVQAIRETLGMSGGEPLVPFSSETRAGRDPLWACIEAAIQPTP